MNYPQHLFVCVNCGHRAWGYNSASYHEDTTSHYMVDEGADVS